MYCFQNFHFNKVRAFLIAFLLITNYFVSHAQSMMEPTDYLTKDFHKGRREALRKLMPDNSVMFVFAYPERVFSRDVNYVYHENPDLYYYSGYNEPNAVLLIFKEMQHDATGSYDEIFFVQKRDSANEIFTGKRLGIDGTRSKLGFDKVYLGDDFDSLCPDLSKLNVIFSGALDGIPYDNDPGNLYTLYQVLQKKAKVSPEDFRGVKADLDIIAKYAQFRYLEDYVQYFQLRAKARKDDSYKNNEFIQQLINHPDSTSFEAIKKKINPSQTKSAPDIYYELTCTMREIKTQEELALLRKAVFISSIAHAEVMKAINANMSERELEGIFLYVHKKYGAEEEGYGAIVGSGANGCTLHYEDNSVTNMQGQMVVMDVAAEYHGYSADVTRSVPATGKYSPEEKAIYKIVYDAQEEIFKLCKEGTPFDSLDSKAKQVLAAGLIKLGLISKASDVGIYYPHGCSHHMGLDVHDKSNYGPLRENMVITVEPGIYIPAGSKCDKKWWNIGVRIEDDVVIGKNSYELLSKDAPRKWEDVEKMTAQKSLFNDFALPAMK